MFKMKNCYLVTGAGGNLGSSFVEILCQNNIDGVTELKLVDLRFRDDLQRKLSQDCAEAKIKVQWLTGSIMDKAFMQKAAEDVDVALHMAGLIDFGRSISEKTIWNVNYEGSIEAVEACFHANVQHFIFTSSSEAVGPNTNRDPMHMGNERTKYFFSPPFMYGKAKHEAEEYILAADGRNLNNGKKFVTCALRPSGFYGGEDPILRTILKITIKDKVLKSPASAACLQTRMRIENVAWSHVLAARKIQVNKKLIGGNAYFLGDDTPNMSYPRLNLQFFKPFGYTVSKREPVLPYWMLYVITIVMLFAAKLLQFVGIKKEVLLTTGALKVATTPFTTSHQKFIDHFEYKPILSWEESLKKTREDTKRILEDIGEMKNKKRA